MSSQSLWVMDLRNTLPNLKYLLLYITSGNGPVYVTYIQLLVMLRNTNNGCIVSNANVPHRHS